MQARDNFNRAMWVVFFLTLGVSHIRAEQAHNSPGSTEERVVEASANQTTSLSGILSRFLKKMEDRKKSKAEAAPYKAEEFACIKSLAEIHQQGISNEYYKRAFSFNDWIFFPLGDGFYGIRELVKAVDKKDLDGKRMSQNSFFLTNGITELKFKIDEKYDKPFSHTNNYEFRIGDGLNPKVEWHSNKGLWADTVRPYNADIAKKKTLVRPELFSKVPFASAYSLDSLMRKSLEKTFRLFSIKRESKSIPKRDIKMASQFVLDSLDEVACRKAGFGKPIDELKSFVQSKE